MLRLLAVLVSMMLLVASCFGGDDDEIATNDEAAEELAMVDDGFHQVEPGETLGEIVDGICGEDDNDLLWHVVDVNSSNQQPDGGYLTHIDQIEIGWFLEIPCEAPQSPLIECPTSATVGFLGTDDRARVAICNTDGRTEYFGQRLTDRDSIILDACETNDGTIRALNQADDGDFYYVVTPSGSPGLEIRQTTTGGNPGTAEVIATYEFETVQPSTGGFRSCSSPEPAPVEEDEVYQLDRAPLIPVEFDTSKDMPEHAECDEVGLGMVALPSIYMPSWEADITKWIEIEQGGRLRIYGIDASGAVVLEGGGLSWPMELEDFDDSYQLLITDEQPLGRYRVTGSSGDPAAKVEVKPATWLDVVLDHSGSGGGDYLYRIYGASASADVTLEVSQRQGCDGTRWLTHQNISVDERSDSGVIKVGLDMSEAPMDEEFCLAVDGTCQATIFPLDG